MLRGSFLAFSEEIGGKRKDMVTFLSQNYSDGPKSTGKALWRSIYTDLCYFHILFGKKSALHDRVLQVDFFNKNWSIEANFRGKNLSVKKKFFLKI